MNTQSGDSVFEGGIDFRGIESSGISADKKVTDAHVKNQLGGSARVGTGEDSDGRGLAESSCLSHGAGLPRVGDRLSLCKTLISFFESGFGALHFDFRPTEGSSCQNSHQGKQ